MLVKLRFNCLLVLVLLLGILATAMPAAAEAISEQDVRIAVASWLNSSPTPCGEQLGTEVGNVKLYRGGKYGDVGYYLVTLLPNGWILLPADDSFWPIQVFGVGRMSEEQFKGSVWHEVVSYNSIQGDYLPNKARMKSNSKRETFPLILSKNKTIETNKSQWKKLLAQETKTRANTLKITRDHINPVPDDVRVAPLLGAEKYWSQGYPFNANVWFHPLTQYTSDGNPNKPYAAEIENKEFYVGCTALATGQQLFYLMANKNPNSLTLNNKILNICESPDVIHEFVVKRTYPHIAPTEPESWKVFDYPAINTSYDFGEMQSYYGFMDAQMQVHVASYMAPMLRDIGVSLSASYKEGGTGAYTKDIPGVLINTFGFPSGTVRSVHKAEGAFSSGKLQRKVKRDTINTNLDLGFPVIIEIKGYDGNEIWRHTNIVDGYGYITQLKSATPYYHFQTGQTGNIFDEEEGRVIWALDEGAWSYDLLNIFDSDIYDTQEISTNTVVYNIIRDLSTISSDNYINYSQVGVTNPVVISGRLVKRKNALSELNMPIPNAEIDVYWGTTKKYTTKTNSNGIFACVVEANKNISLKVVSPEVNLLANPIWSETIGENNSVSSTSDLTIENNVANKWLEDVMPPGIVGVASQYETSADLGAMFIAKNKQQNDGYITINKTDLATVDLTSLGDGVLFIGSDPAFDYNGNYDTDTVINVMQFVRNGGTVVTSGKSTAFPGLVGFSKGLRFYSFSGLPKPYGATKSISTRVSAWANHIKQYMHGQDTFNMVSALSARDHSLISDPGNTSAFAIGTYVFESMIWGPWGPELDYNLTYVPAGTTIEYGDNGGKLIYINGEFSLNHAEGGLARDFVNALIDPILFKADDEESLSDAVGGEYGALGGQPVAMNSLNLKSVVYNNGVTVNNIATSDDVSFVFTVTDRIADSSAPDLAVSDDAVPTLTVSLRNPAGEVVAAKQTPTSADSTLAFALSGDAAVAGEWKMVVENVDGFDGRRVVVAASITGDYDIGDAVTLPPPSNAAMAMYPRGAAGDTFSYQLGDGTMTLSDTGLRKLALGALVKPEYLDFARIDDDLVVRIKGGLNKIKLPGWFKRMGSDFFEVTFAGGRKLSGREVKKLAVVREPEIDITPLMIEERLRGTDGRDSLSGKTKNAFLFAGKGDDAISGGSGDNVYYYRKGDGNDTITLGDKKNVLRFHLEIEPEEVTAARDGGDMVFDLDGGSVRIKDWFRGSKLTRIEFPGGVVWDDRDVEKLAAGKKLTPREYYLAPPAEPKAEGLPAGTGGGCNSGIPVVSLMSVAVGWAVVRRRKR